MLKALVVTQAFGTYARGDRIVRPDEVKRIAVSHAQFVRAVEDGEPEPMAEKSPAPQD